MSKYKVTVMHGNDELGSFVEELQSQNPQAIIEMAQDGVTGMIREATKRGVKIDLKEIHIELEEMR